MAPAPDPASGAPIPVVVAGALGRMGAEVVRAVLAAPDCTLVAAIEPYYDPSQQHPDNITSTHCLLKNLFHMKWHKYSYSCFEFSAPCTWLIVSNNIIYIQQFHEYVVWGD